VLGKEMIVGMGNKDAEDFGYMTSPDFWRMIANARREATVRLKDVEAVLFSDDGAPSGNQKG
jgi:hypothetical protein